MVSSLLHAGHLGHVDLGDGFRVNGPMATDSVDCSLIGGGDSLGYLFRDDGWSVQLHYALGVSGLVAAGMATKNDSMVE